MRRRGASQVEIEATLLQQNAQRCVPPLDDDEVRKIAASVASYPEGGPDLLDTAWKAVSEKQHASNYEKFVALAQELQRTRGDFPVALPTERIAGLFECHRTLVGAWRRAAIWSDVMQQVEPYIKLRQAALFRVDPAHTSPTLLARNVSKPSSGIARIACNSPPMPTSENRIPDQVVRLAARGWRLFPCRENAKEPLVSGWPDVATSDVHQIAEWCGRFPSCNWACATGAGSGVWVLDVDGEEGLSTFYMLCKHHGFFDTLGVKTSSRSSHLYFRWPTNGDVVRNSVKILPGLDVRGERGYVIVPPSVHPDGSTYEWLGELESIIDTPAWLVPALNENGPLAGGTESVAADN